MQDREFAFILTLKRTNSRKPTREELLTESSDVKRFM